jgi:predicted RNA-binding protein YlxR (DUF448 family)
MLGQRSQIELDRGPQSRGLERFCVVARAVRPVDEMIRFVIAPDGEAVPDLKRHLPGRGVWVTGTRKAVDKAVKAGAFRRGFRCELRVAADLAVRTEALLEAAMIDALAIARKAGLIVTGARSVETALLRAKVVALLDATGMAPNLLKEPDATLPERRGAAAVTVVRLTPSQLDLALGRPNVIHAALLAGRASSTFMVRLRRLERFRTEPDWE